MKGDTMRKDYMDNQQADLFLVGFKYKRMYYITTLEVSDFVTLCKYDKTSKSHGRKACLRFKPTAEQKRNLITGTYGTYAICWGDELSLKREMIWRENKGHTFERLMREQYNGTPCKNCFWWNGGDFKCYNTIFQVKLENGTACTAEQCRKVRVEA